MSPNSQNANFDVFERHLFKLVPEFQPSGLWFSLLASGDTIRVNHVTHGLGDAINQLLV